ncbi:MAG: ankyrin repeat domain-containing protein [Planctomyces sp.]|nr:ankyrin repeat domain-containing protein [Planctomyces sp.]
MTFAIHEAVRIAAFTGNVAAIKELVAEHGPALVRLDTDPDELTTLHLASAGGHVEVVQYLLSPPVQADPCAARNNNFTPLHSAAMHGHSLVCEMLIKAGADVNTQTNPQGYAPLHSAAFAGHVATIELLLRNGANRTLLNYRDEEPADTARRTGQAKAAELLDTWKAPH